MNKPDLKLSNYRKIFNDVKKCSKGVKRGKIEMCFDYCDYFKINSLSPIMEGYTVHMNLLMEHL